MGVAMELFSSNVSPSSAVSTFALLIAFIASRLEKKNIKDASQFF
jgi:hypothetical protein